MMNMNSDLDLKIYYGDPIEVSEGVFVYPKTMRDIKDIGEVNYNQMLNLALLDKNNLNDGFLTEEGNEIKNKMDNFPFICFISSQIDFIRESLCEALSFFLNDNVFFDDNLRIFVVGNNLKIIDEEVFFSIQDILRQQNYISESNHKEFKPHNEKAKELIEKMKEIKAKLQQQNKDEGLRLSDIISIVSNYSNDINIFTVWDLTVYQLYESYMRILMWDDYHNNLSLLPHTSDQSSLKLDHWAIKTKNKIKEDSV